MMVTCPHCGDTNDVQSQMTSGGEPPLPKNGDVSICFTCGWLAVFDDSTSMNTRLPTTSEYEQYTDDPILVRTVGMVSIGLQKIKTCR